MSSIIIVLIIVGVLALGAVAAMQVRSATLRRRFGSEYDRLVEQEGDRRRAEAALRERVKRRQALEIRGLSPETVQLYAREWREAQHDFVDEPEQSVGRADELVERVLRERGYPVAEVSERFEMVSVDHAGLTESYRAAHAVHIRSADATVSLDTLREAFQGYRALFNELLVEDEPAVNVAEGNAA
jgi:hypothetical protein